MSARASLAISLEVESKDVLTSRIKDKSLRDFATATSQRVAKLSGDEILAHTGRISSTSGRMLSLVSWCNEHRGNDSAWKVVEFALETITGDQTYSPSLRSLRQLAQAVRPEKSPEVARIIQRIDLIKVTAIRTPLEEGIWLELALARLERQFDEEQGKTRMLEAYYSIETHNELYAQTYALLRILLVSPSIDPNDSLEVTKEAEKSLKTKFLLLLNSAAHHEEVVGRLLTALARSKHDLAIELAQQLNTLRRREVALQKILASYAESKGTSVDLNVAERILNLISTPTRRQYSKVQLTHILSETDLFTKRPETRPFLRQCSEIEHPSNKCHCLAFTMNAMEQAGDIGYVTAQYKTLIEELERIDTKSAQVELGLTLASILGKRVPRFAKKLFEYSKSKRLESPLAEEFFERIYTRCLDLCIKLLTREVLQRTTEPSPTDQVIFLINQVPSAAYQCRQRGLWKFGQCDKW